MTNREVSGFSQHYAVTAELSGISGEGRYLPAPRRPDARDNEAKSEQLYALRKILAAGVACFWQKFSHFKAEANLSTPQA
jgi:hypothetical protein